MAALDTAPAGFSAIVLKYGPYSASKLLVARCPARFQGKYVLHDRVVGDSLNAARGSAIHWVLQQITEAQVAGTALTPVMVNAWVTEALGKYPAAYEQVKLVKDAAAAYVGNPPKRKGNVIMCEAELAVGLYEEDSFLDDTTLKRVYVKASYMNEDGTTYNKSAYIGGKLDRVDIDDAIKTVTVTDHKSTPNASENSDNNFQVGIYAWLAHLYWPGYKIKTVIHYAHPDLNFYAPPVEYTDEDFLDIEDEIHTRISAIESFQEYPALPGGHCTYCHMTQQCPEYLAVEQQNARGQINLNINGIDDLVRVAKQLTVTGNLYDQLNKVLKKGIENHCPNSGIAIDGLWYGFRPGQEKVDWQATEAKIAEEVGRAKQAPDDLGAKRLVEMGGLDGILAKHGVSPEAFKQWRSDKLKSLWKLDKPELIEFLKPYLVFDRDTRFSGYKT